MTRLENKAERPPHSPLYQIAEGAANVYRGIVIESALKDRKEIGAKGRWDAFERSARSRFPYLEEYVNVISRIAQHAEKEKGDNANIERRALNAFKAVNTQDSRQFLADASIVKASNNGQNVEEAAAEVKKEVGLLRLNGANLTDLVMDVFKNTIKTGPKDESKRVKAA